MFTKENLMPFYRGYIAANKDLPEELMNPRGLLRREGLNDQQLIAVINKALILIVKTAKNDTLMDLEAKKMIAFLNSAIEERKDYGWLYLMRGLINSYLKNSAALDEDLKKLKTYEVDNIMVSYLMIKAAVLRNDLELAENLMGYAQQLKYNALIQVLFQKLNLEITKAQKSTPEIIFFGLREITKS